jgi:hypothetical protein
LSTHHKFACENIFFVSTSFPNKGGEEDFRIISTNIFAQDEIRDKYFYIKGTFYNAWFCAVTKAKRDAGPNNVGNGKFRQTQRSSGPIYADDGLFRSIIVDDGIFRLIYVDDGIFRSIYVDDGLFRSTYLDDGIFRLIYVDDGLFRSI